MNYESERLPASRFVIILYSLQALCCGTCLYQNTGWNYICFWRVAGPAKPKASPLEMNCAESAFGKRRWSTGASWRGWHYHAGEHWAGWRCRRFVVQAYCYRIHLLLLPEYASASSIMCGLAGSHAELETVGRRGQWAGWLPVGGVYTVRCTSIQSCSNCTAWIFL